MHPVRLSCVTGALMLTSSCTCLSALQVFLSGRYDAIATSPIVSVTIAQGYFSRSLKVTDTHFLPADGVMAYARDAAISASLTFMGEDDPLHTGTIVAKDIVLGIDSPAGQ